MLKRQGKRTISSTRRVYGVRFSSGRRVAGLLYFWIAMAPSSKKLDICAASRKLC